MQPTKGQDEILQATGHLLVTGGPGSGKTTVAILKAAAIAEYELQPGQKVLFLSFARATVSRVVEAIEYEKTIPAELKNRIGVETYHAFFWRILKTHGYLIGLPRRLFILAPSSESVALSSIRSRFPRKLDESDKARKRKLECDELTRLACVEGQVCFDFFAEFAGEILTRSMRIRKLIAGMYPVIVLDEFQDTDVAQWHIVQALGEHCRLIALGDSEQRIYDWKGADPERLNHLRKAFAPTEKDLSADNHRSTGTDIVAFGNDILKGKFRKEPYVGVNCLCYPPANSPAYTCLVNATYAARKRLLDSEKKEWSLAVLVPTRRMTRLVSDVFQSPPGGKKEIPHSAVIEIEAIILAAAIIAFQMQPSSGNEAVERFIHLLGNYFQGKGGDEPTKSDLKEAENLQRAFDKWRASGTLSKKSILFNVVAVYESTRSLKLTGQPDVDWRMVRQVMEDGPCPRLREIASEARNLRLLRRGTQLRQELVEDWLANGTYANALYITQQAFVGEHFSHNFRPETGVVVMNMHKAKGKQFDEVIIFEGWPRRKDGEIIANPDRIVRGNKPENADVGARQNFRVSITRGKSQTTILTPKTDPCVLLHGIP